MADNQSVRQQQRLWHPLLDVDMLRLEAELRGVDVASDGGHYLNGQLPKPGEQSREQVAGAVAKTVPGVTCTTACRPSVPTTAAGSHPQHR